MKENTTWFRRIPLELVFWIGSMIAIQLINPNGGHHLSLCPLENLGITWCPGCGLGRSMNLLTRGEFHASWSMHPLAMLAFAVILHRIWTLIKNFKTNYYHG